MNIGNVITESVLDEGRVLLRFACAQNIMKIYDNLICPMKKIGIICHSLDYT